MKRFVLAAFCTVSLVSFVLAEEFTAVITKVDGSKITYFKAEAAAGAGKKGGGAKKGGGGAVEKKGDAIVGTATSGVKVVKGKAGDAVEGGLTSDTFKMIDAEKGVTVTLTVADDGADKGKITQIAIKGGGKGGAAKKGGNQ